MAATRKKKAAKKSAVRRPATKKATKKRAPARAVAARAGKKVLGNPRPGWPYSPGWHAGDYIFTAGQIIRSADGDIRSLMDDYRKKGFLS